MIEMDKRTDLVGLSQDELVGFVAQIGEPAYRGRQIFAALQHRRLQTFALLHRQPEHQSRQARVPAPASVSVTGGCAGASVLLHFRER